MLFDAELPFKNVVFWNVTEAAVEKLKAEMLAFLVMLFPLPSTTKDTALLIVICDVCVTLLSSTMISPFCTAEKALSSVV